MHSVLLGAGSEARVRRVAPAPGPVTPRCPSSGDASPSAIFLAFHRILKLQKTLSTRTYLGEIDHIPVKRVGLPRSSGRTRDGFGRFIPGDVGSVHT